MPADGYINTDGPYTGLSKQQLLQCAYSPLWVRARFVLFLLFWVSWLTMLAGAIALVMTTPKCNVPEPLQWWQTSPVYQVCPLSYKDGSQPQDGMGDIAGMKLNMAYGTIKFNAGVKVISELIHPV